MTLLRQFEAKSESPFHTTHHTQICAPLRRDERSSSRPDALIHPLGDRIPARRLSWHRWRSAWGRCPHPSVDGGTTDADALDDPEIRCGLDHRLRAWERKEEPR